MRVPGGRRCILRVAGRYAGIATGGGMSAEIDLYRTAFDAGLYHPGGFRTEIACRAKHLGSIVNASRETLDEGKIRPGVIHRKVANGYRAKWAADAEADLLTTIDTARLSVSKPFHIILGTVTA